jgi:hypothetical protein
MFNIVHDSVSSLLMERYVRGETQTFVIGDYSVTVQHILPGSGIGNRFKPWHVYNNFNKTYKEHGTEQTAVENAHRMLGVALKKALAEGLL